MAHESIRPVGTDETLEALRLVVGFPCALVLEGTSEQVQAELRAAGVPPWSGPCRGLTFGRVSTTHRAMLRISDIAAWTSFMAVVGRHAEPEICDHVHFCSHDESVVSWYDFPGGELHISQPDLAKRLRGVLEPRNR